MSAWQGLGYVLRRGWLWPLRFWLRPMQLMEEAKQHKWDGTEQVSAVFGGLLWGLVVGVLLWAATGELDSVWVLTAATVVAVAGAAPFAAASCFASNVPYSVVGAFAGIFYLFLGALGITMGAWLSDSILEVVIITAGAVLFVLGIWCAGSGSTSERGIPKWAFIAFLVDGLLLLPLLVLALFTHLKVSQILPWSAAVAIGFGVAVLTGLVDTLKQPARNRDLPLACSVQSGWLLGAWLLFYIPSLGTWLYDFKTPELNAKMGVLALCLVLAPPIITGLLFYPLVAVLAWWQYRPTQPIGSAAEAFYNSFPFRWRSFAYPLPGLRRVLHRFAREQGAKSALDAIQALQFRTLQGAVAQSTFLELAQEPATALDICGQIAMDTNLATFVSLCPVGPATRALAVLAKEEDKGGEQPLRIYTGTCPNPFRLLVGLSQKSSTSNWSEDLLKTRKQGLVDRIDYARQALDGLDERDFAYSTNFRKLLDAVASHLEVQTIQDVQWLPTSISNTAEQPAWLQGGWYLLSLINKVVIGLDGPRVTNSPLVWRVLSGRLRSELESEKLSGLPDFWINIGRELIDHWLKHSQQGIELDGESLALDIELVSGNIGTGHQALQFAIRNPTRVDAKDLRLWVDKAEGLEWRRQEARYPVLVGEQSVLISVDLVAPKPGNCSIGGSLEAEDHAGNSVSTVFSNQLQIILTGRVYRTPDYPPYVVGEGLPNDRTFAGRRTLMLWLGGLWRQPQGKPAVVLVGQRRIGKTSVLNKVVRDRRESTGLLPVLLNIQGVQGDYDFLSDTGRKMAAALGREPPRLDREEAYAGFKAFLLGLKPDLDRRRFLLMLDEADLIPKRGLGDSLLGFLRALMQEPEYPVVLLFCGTHALRRMGRDYDSILFNTARVRTLSYLDVEESAELLQKPVRGVLEFDPAALRKAHRLTHGQPLLLQSLGAVLVERLDDLVLAGEERSNYVGLGDMERAAVDLVEQEDANAAFENHWQDCDTATHRLLSALAWATTRATTNRAQLDIQGIEEGMVETRLELSRERTFAILERLTEEEFLTRAGPTYRFTVPLYRRWVAWRWPPELVREEAL